MSEIEQLVERAVSTVSLIARRAAGFANRLLLGAVVVCGGGFLLGLAALSGGIRSVWIVLGIVFGSIAIGNAFIARWRVGAVRRHAPELATEVRALLTDGREATRTVVESFVVRADGDADGAPTGSAIVLSRQMHGMRDVAGSTLGSSARLTAAVTALTTFPLLVLTTIAISLVFAFLGFVFLIALAL